MAPKDGNFIGNATKTLARKLNTQVSKVRETRAHLMDSQLLGSEVVDVEIVCHIGFPDNADSVAYEPYQKLLAVGTRDGKVKIVGSDGVELIMCGESSSGTAYLGFLKKRAALLRVTEDGHVELFSLVSRSLLDSIWIWSDDKVTDVSPIPGGPYLLLGCESGTCRVILVSSRGQLSLEEGAPASSLKQLPYQILAEDVDGAGPVVSAQVTQYGDRPLALLVYRDSGAVVWDIRGERALVTALDDVDDPSKPTTACWVGNRSNCFAVGYDDGSIIVWGVPASTLKANPGSRSTIHDAVLILALKPCSDDRKGGPIKDITFIPGGSGTPYDKDCLMVLGGQEEGVPDMISLLSLEPEDKEEDTVIIPWFGTVVAHSLMDPAESEDVASHSILILTEGGQLVVHDIASASPSPLSLKFQELPPITYSKFVPSYPEEIPGNPSTSHRPTLRSLRFLSLKYITDSKWPFTGGVPPGNYFNSEAEYMVSRMREMSHPSACLYMGFRDGRVRLYDATSEVPRYLMSVPQTLDILAPEGRLRGVSCIEVCSLSGLLAVGHEDGVVRVYQFSTTAQSARKVSLDDSLVPYDTPAPQEPGWQYVLKYAIHDCEITSLCFATKPGLLAVGDCRGSVSVIDLTRPQRVFESTLKPGVSIMSFAFGYVKIQTEDQKLYEPDEVLLSLFISLKDGTLHILSAQSGDPVCTKPLKPKSSSQPLMCCLFDEHGSFIGPLCSPLILPWADNSAAAMNRSIGMMQVSGLSHGRRLDGPSNSFELQDADTDDELDAALDAAIQEQENKKKSGMINLFRKKDMKDDESDEEDIADVPIESDLWSGVNENISPPVASEAYPDGDYYHSRAIKSGESITNVSMVFLGCSEHLRVYTMDTLLEGERVTEGKVKLEDPIQFCGFFDSVSGSGLITIGKSIKIFGLPKLESVDYMQHHGDAKSISKRLNECIASSDNTARTWCCSLDGQLVLRTPSNELIRLISLRSTPRPDRPHSISSDSTPTPSYTKHADVKENPLRASAKSMGSLFTSVKGMTSVASGAVTAATGAFMSEIDKAMNIQNKPLPPLNVIFQKEIKPLDEDIDFLTEDECMDIKISSKKDQKNPSTANHPPPMHSSVDKRKELLTPASRSVVGGSTSRTKPLSKNKRDAWQRRTLSEVKRVYGNTRAQDARATMERNRELLAERGRKLANLEAQSAAMQGDAEDFASMAQELEKAFANRKWWQF